LGVRVPSETLKKEYHENTNIEKSESESTHRQG